MASEPLPQGPFADEHAATWRCRRDLRTALLVWLLCLLVYNANVRLIAAGDTYAARYLPFGILRYHTLTLDPIATIVAQGRKIGVPPGQKHPPDEWMVKAYWIVRGSGGHAISLYPVTLPVLLTPIYLPALIYLDARGWDPWRLDWIARVMEKLSASLLAATSAALLYLLLRRRTGFRSALLLTLAYAFGTTTWMIGSQALWQHGLTELLIVGMLLTVTGPCTPRTVIAAGLFCGLIACNRPPDSILAAAIAIYGLHWAGRKAPLLIAASLMPVLLLLAYNFGVAGHYAGGYGLVGKKKFFAHDPLSGLAGLLFSPARGLFVFSPFLLFLPFFAGRILRDRRNRFLTISMCAAVLLQVAVYSETDWRQGSTWGPRWLTSMLPILFWMLPPVFDALRPAARIVFGVMCAAAIAIEVIGAFWYTGAGDAAIFAIPTGPGAMRAAWNPRNAPFLAELAHPRAPAELMTTVRGSLDIAKTNDGLDLSAGSNGGIALEGWSLANGSTPREVLAMLDGHVVASASDFFVRPDVTKALRIPAPSGWRMSIPAQGLVEGEHLLAIFVRATEGGDIFLLVERRFTNPAVSVQAMARQFPTEEKAPDDLALNAQQAASNIAAHQRDPGYWLTAYTHVRSYHHPREEMNIFLNAVMIDLIAPIAQQAHLTRSIQKVRHFLTAQIEDDGLVRYHGRVDAPTIGTLGCAITPDADDTALVWRVAPDFHRERLSSALRILNRFRTDGGLYKTWLAPQDRYQCIDPGKTPDPADVVIQMHVLMLLTIVNRPAAQAMCTALARAIEQDDNWVYYRLTPLIPILRVADLENAGCRLGLPPSRLRTTVAGQEVWITAASMLEGFMGTSSHLPASAKVTGLLSLLSRDNFSPLRQSPPLIYHNDLTASVPRFYWSEDMGYALWLRLYFENARVRSAHGGM